jgi:hypothetical protein
LGVRAVIRRLAAALVVAMLAAPSTDMSWPGSRQATDAPSPQDRGMDARPGPVVAASIAVAPTTLAAPAAAVAGAVWTCTLVPGARVADDLLRAAGALRPAPAVLRL